METFDTKRRHKIEIEGYNLENYRSLGTTLKSGAYKELYTGHIVYNSGFGSANLKIFTPKTPEFEKALEEMRSQQH